MSSKIENDDSKQRLLSAAKKLFADFGFDGTKVRDIADAAGVNLSLVSYHFDGKEGLYRAVIDQFGRERLAAAERLMQSVSSAEELKVRVKMLLAEIMNVHLAEPHLTLIVHREIESNVPFAKDVFEQTFLKCFSNCVSFFKSAQKQGIIRKDIDVVTLTTLLHGAMKYMIVMDPISTQYFNRSMRDPKHREKLIEDFIRIIFEGAFKREGADQ